MNRTTKKSAIFHSEPPKRDKLSFYLRHITVNTPIKLRYFLLKCFKVKTLQIDEFLEDNDIKTILNSISYASKLKIDLLSNKKQKIRIMRRTASSLRNFEYGPFQKNELHYLPKRLQKLTLGNTQHFRKFPFINLMNLKSLDFGNNNGLNILFFRNCYNLENISLSTMKQTRIFNCNLLRRMTKITNFTIWAHEGGIGGMWLEIINFFKNLKSFKNLYCSTPRNSLDCLKGIIDKPRFLKGFRTDLEYSPLNNLSILRELKKAHQIQVLVISANNPQPKKEYEILASALNNIKNLKILSFGISKKIKELNNIAQALNQHRSLEVLYLGARSMNCAAFFIKSLDFPLKSLGISSRFDEHDLDSGESLIESMIYLEVQEFKLTSCWIYYEHLDYLMTYLKRSKSIKGFEFISTNHTLHFINNKDFGKFFEVVSTRKNLERIKISIFRDIPFHQIEKIVCNFNERSSNLKYLDLNFNIENQEEPEVESIKDFMISLKNLAVKIDLKLRVDYSFSDFSKFEDIVKSNAFNSDIILNRNSLFDE